MAKRARANEVITLTKAARRRKVRLREGRMPTRRSSAAAGFPRCTSILRAVDHGLPVLHEEAAAGRLASALSRSRRARSGSPPRMPTCTPLCRQQVDRRVEVTAILRFGAEPGEARARVAHLAQPLAHVYAEDARGLAAGVLALVGHVEHRPRLAPSASKELADAQRPGELAAEVGAALLCRPGWTPPPRAPARAG